MDLRGKPEINMKVGAYGGPVRYQRDAYDGMHKRVAQKCANLGGTAELKAFVPVLGQKLLIYFLKLAQAEFSIPTHLIEFIAR